MKLIKVRLALGSDDEPFYIDADKILGFGETSKRPSDERKLRGDAPMIDIIMAENCGEDGGGDLVVYTIVGVTCEQLAKCLGGYIDLASPKINWEKTIQSRPV